MNLLKTGLKDKKCLVIGGAGFLGSAVAKRALDQDADVTILARKSDDHALSGVNMIIGDARDALTLRDAIRGMDFIFNFAGSINHTESDKSPSDDLEINQKMHLTLLDLMAKEKSQAKITFSSTRLVLGKTRALPITEDHPADPTCLYGIHKLAAENYYKMYQRKYGVRSVIVRISNAYGYASGTKFYDSPLPNKFLAAALRGEEIRVHDEGKELRDYIHVDDVAEACIRFALKEESSGEIYNLARGESVSIIDMAKMAIKEAGLGAIKSMPRPEEFAASESGDVEMDIAKLKSLLDWAPQISLREGLAGLKSVLQSGAE